MNRVNAIKNKYDLQRMSDWLKNNKPIRYYVIFLLALNSGLRISDVLGLDIEDVENKNFVEIHEKKTGKYKNFPLNTDIQNVIREYLKERKKQYAIEGNPLFVGKKHCRIDRSQVYRVLNECAKALGMTIHIGCHSTRKSFGYAHYKQYNNIGLLQTILNHSSPSITLRYIDVTQEEIDKSYLNLDLGIKV